MVYCMYKKQNRHRINLKRLIVPSAGIEPAQFPIGV